MANLYKIKSLAEQKGISLRELASKVGISEQQIHLMCRVNSTKVNTLEKIANILQVPTSTFFDDQPATPQLKFQQNTGGGPGYQAEEIKTIDNRIIYEDCKTAVLKREIAKQKVRIESQIKELSGKNETIESLHNQIEARDRHIVDLQETVKELRERVRDYKESKTNNTK